MFTPFFVGFIFYYDKKENGCYIASFTSETIETIKPVELKSYNLSLNILNYCVISVPFQLLDFGHKPQLKVIYIALN